MQTDFLFAKPNFVSGVAAVLDFGGTLVNYNVSQNEREADLRALASDWAMVGEDVKHSVEIFQREQNSPETQEQSDCDAR